MRSELATGVPAAPTQHGPPEGLVAPLLPATAQKPEPARKINFLVALLFYWLVPKRLGPHLAVASWKRAWLAHVLALASAGLIILFGTHALEGIQRHPNLSYREQLAAYIIDAATRSAQGRGGGIEILLVLSAIPALEIALFLLAVMLMPFCAGGDRAGSVFRRSMKNVLWSTTFFVPAAVLYMTLFNWGERMGAGRLGRAPELLELGVVLAAFLLPMVWWLRLLFVGARQYVGEPDGPAFAPREPHCDDCGYLIVHLPLSNRCPECGLRVAESLPGGRRKRTDWQRHPLDLEGLGAFFKMHHRARTSRDFFKTLPVHDGLAKARHFWWLTCGMLVIANLAIIAVAGIRGWFLPYYRSVDAGPAVLNIPLLLAVQALVSFAVCLWGQWRHGIRDYRSSAIVCYYGASRIWGWWIMLTIIEALFVARLFQPFTGIVVFPVHGVEVDLAMLLAAALTLIMIAAAGWWVLSLARGLRQIRYANV